MVPPVCGVVPGSRRFGAVSLGLVAATTLVSLAVLPRLPAEMAIHFDASGAPDNYFPRTAGALFTPALMAATLLFLKGAARVDPPDDELVFGVVSAATMLLMAGVHLYVLGWNLGYRVPSETLWVGIGVWTVALIGFVVVRERGGAAV